MKLVSDHGAGGGVTPDDPSDEFCRLLPAWFTPRMLDDEWAFGLLLVTGVVLGISHIERVVQAADGSLWLDVDMMENYASVSIHKDFWSSVVVAPTSRLRASVNAAHVVAAVELADT